MKEHGVMMLLMGLIFSMTLMTMGVEGQSANPPVWPQRTATVGQWRCMHVGLGCANVGSWGQFQSYLQYDDQGNFLNYREDVVVNSTTDQLPYIRELISAPQKSIWEYFLANSSSPQLQCFVRHGTFVWPAAWAANASYLGLQTFHGREVYAYQTKWIFFGLPNVNIFYVDVQTNTFVGWYQPTGGLEYQWFTYQSLAAFPTSTWFDGPAPTAPCSQLLNDKPLPWR